MALKPASLMLLLLLDLTLLIHGVASLCNVACSTDYSVSLNCSCSAPTHPVVLTVSCSDGELEVNGACEVKPPQLWCVMYPEMLEDVASIGTMCTASVSQRGDEAMTNASESSSWALGDVVKPLPPFDVQVKNVEGFYNITWDHDGLQDCLKYTVRVRGPSKDPVYSLSVEQKHLLLDQRKLQPHLNYTVEVKAKWCPGVLYEGPWSEWSSSAQCGARGKAETEGTHRCLLYVSTSIASVLGFLVLLHCLRKPFAQKKMHMFTYIPKPDTFFTPLYHNYGGNFKEWVKPVFSENDYLQMKCEKQHDVLRWDGETRSYREDVRNHGGHFPHSNSLLLFWDGSGGSGAGHSSGHISIRTLTLSGEEEFGEEVVPQSPDGAFRGHQEGPNFGSSGDHRGRAGCDPEEPQGSMSDGPHPDDQISQDSSEENASFQSPAQLAEPEVASLDSFASGEPSEDGYPHVDLDTIDSGFGECSSPGGPNRAERTDSSFDERGGGSNSNYVKQWMACGAALQPASDAESELQQAQ